MSNRTRQFIFLCLLTLAVIASCTTTPEPTPLPPTLDTPATTTPVPLPTVTVGVVPETSGELADRGQIRLIHAAPESGVFDIYLESALIAGRLAPGSFTSPVALPEDEYYLQVVPVNALPSTQVLAELTFTLEPEKSLFILVAGAPDALNIEVYEEDLSPTAEGEARLAFLHAVPRGPAFGALVDGKTVETEVDFGQLSASTTELSGLHELSYVSGPNTLATTSVSLPAGYASTAVLVGKVGGGNYQTLLISTPIVKPGRVRLVNALADGPIQMALDGTSITGSIANRAWSGWHEVKPRTYALTVTSAEGEPDTAPLVSTQFNPASNRAYVALVYSDQGSPALRIFDVPETPTRATHALLTTFNAASEAPSVQLQSQDSLLSSLPSITFGSASRPHEILASSANLVWVASQPGASNIIETVAAYTFEEGHSYLYVVTGDDETPFVITDDVGVVDSAAAEPTIRHTVKVRVINGLSANEAVTVILEDIELVSNLAPHEGSVPQVLPGGAYQLTAATAGGAATTEVSLLNLTQAALLVYGQPDDPQITVLPDYHTSVQQAQSVLRVIHGAPLFGALSARLEVPETSGTQLDMLTPNATLAAAAELQDRRRMVETAQFGPAESSEFMAVPAGTYLLEVTLEENGQTVGLIPRLAIEGGKLYDLLLLPGENSETLDPVLISRRN